MKPPIRKTEDGGKRRPIRSANREVSVEQAGALTFCPGPGPLLPPAPLLRRDGEAAVEGSYGAYVAPQRPRSPS